VLREFTGICSLILIEKVDEKLQDAGSYSPSTVNVYWWGVILQSAETLL